MRKSIIIIAITLFLMNFALGAGMMMLYLKTKTEPIMRLDKCLASKVEWLDFTPYISTDGLIECYLSAKK